MLFCLQLTAMGHATLAMIVIGNEILSGRTREANAWLVARRMFERGCKLGEIAVIPDQREAIVSTLRRLSPQFEAVITSGGIGPTHDDITMSCVAEAFGVKLVEHPETLERMMAYYGGERLNPGRRRMARLPEGAEPIVCGKTLAPGARLGNVYVLAGVPDIFASQLEVILPEFGGRPFHRIELEVKLPESRYAAALSSLQERFQDVEIGSYPGRCGPSPCGKICLSSQDRHSLEQAADLVRRMLEELEPFTPEGSSQGD